MLSYESILKFTLDEAKRCESSLKHQEAFFYYSYYLKNLLKSAQEQINEGTVINCAVPSLKKCEVCSAHHLSKLSASFRKSTEKEIPPDQFEEELKSNISVYISQLSLIRQGQIEPKLDFSQSSHPKSALIHLFFYQLFSKSEYSAHSLLKIIKRIISLYCGTLTWMYRTSSSLIAKNCTILVESRPKTVSHLDLGKLRSEVMKTSLSQAQGLFASIVTSIGFLCEQYLSDRVVFDDLCKKAVKLVLTTQLYHQCFSLFNLLFGLVTGPDEQSLLIDSSRYLLNMTKKRIGLPPSSCLETEHEPTVCVDYRFFEGVAGSPYYFKMDPSKVNAPTLCSFPRTSAHLATCFIPSITTLGVRTLPLVTDPRKICSMLNDALKFLVEEMRENVTANKDIIPEGEVTVASLLKPPVHILISLASIAVADAILFKGREGQYLETVMYVSEFVNPKMLEENFFIKHMQPIVKIIENARISAKSTFSASK
ncbi:hypothetical protein ADUPG1_013078 [Aduncisulcus paluster]|uniref:Uncharacterized protein n=1 Tax=Aduncisulcus paluster TaxID=2918883 RepID=A0ABQ5K5B0_9EUKA|nr:hypothetical protein ADUPG1_013078 [Aduncisulcus paluster]